MSAPETSDPGSPRWSTLPEPVRDPRRRAGGRRAARRADAARPPYDGSRRSPRAAGPARRPAPSPRRSPTTRSASGSAIQVAARAQPDDADDAGGGRTRVADPPRRLGGGRWRHRLARIVEAAASASGRELERLRRRLADAEQSVRELRVGPAGRARTSSGREHQAENASLRRRLGEARAAERECRARGRPGARRSSGRVRAEAESRGRGRSRSETRRLRGQVERAWTPRRSRRAATPAAERDAATMRTRLLLDTLIDAATGLRRELALPDRRGRAGRPGRGGRGGLGRARTPSSAGRPAAPTDPALLEQLPRAAAGAPDRRRLQRQQAGLARARRWRRSATGWSAAWRRWWRAPAPRRRSSSTPPRPTTGRRSRAPRGVRVLLQPARA